jgi:hypothetical protein
MSPFQDAFWQVETLPDGTTFAPKRFWLARNELAFAYSALAARAAPLVHSLPQIDTNKGRKKLAGAYLFFTPIR